MAEFDVIEKFFLGAMMPEHVRIGPGDDCAVLSLAAGDELCVSTDALVEGVHFPSDAEPGLISRRAIGANLSDLAAMGATPHGMTLALTIPTLDEVWLAQFAAENQRLAELHQCPIVGGNLANGPLSICITVMGTTPRGQSLLRSGAKEQDDIYVSGDLGGAAGAVVQLGKVNAEAEFFQAYDNPQPRLSLGQNLLGTANSAIDISDGLLADLSHILQASDKGASLDLQSIPVAPRLSTVFGTEQALKLALSGGDDYELCFTASPEDAERVQRLAALSGTKVTRIGTITAEPGIIRNQAQQIVSASGYQHFSD